MPRGAPARSRASPLAGPERLGFAQVAFAGHSRPEDLSDLPGASGRLDDAWRLLAAAGLAEGRLLCGHAGGSDRLAIDGWRRAGFGPVQLVLPFLDDPGAQAPPTELAADAVRLDGAAARARLRSPHLTQSRWIVAAADLLVVVWNGGAPRGSGGTADTVRLALEHGVPVLWIHPGEAALLRLIQPQYLFEDCGLGELLDQIARTRPPLVVEATPETLGEALRDLGLAEPAALKDPGPDPGPKLAPHWRTYAAFRRWLGGRPAPSRRPAPPPDLVSQGGFDLMTRMRASAAREAQRLGAVHRSKQVILLAIAIAMATAGSSPSMWPDLKLPMVALELVLAVFAYVVWLGSQREGQHLRWGAARKRAEDLRLERVAWALGLSTVPHDPLSNNDAAARQVRRRAGLPSGPYGPDRVRAWGVWAIEELLVGQAGYHRDQAAINGRISHRLHLAENLSFAALLLLLVSFLVYAVALSEEFGHAPKWLAGLVFMAGAMVPAIGAACLALDATLSIEEQAHRSAILERQLETLRLQLGSTWGLEDLQGVARAAIRLQKAQEDHWSDNAGRRRLFRGG